MNKTKRKDEILKQLAEDFKNLTTKVEKDNNTKTKQLNETLQILEECRVEYKNLYN